MAAKRNLNSFLFHILNAMNGGKTASTITYASETGKQVGAVLHVLSYVRERVPMNTWKIIYLIRHNK